MTAGITIYNTANTVQIDETYRNMLLIYSGQFTANDANTNADLWWLNFQSVWNQCTKNAIIAIRAPAPGLCLGPGSYRAGRKVTNFFYPRGQSVTFQFYVFDLVGPALADRVGMQVFDGGGSLCYSAGDFPLRVIAHVDTRVYSGDYIWTGPHANIAACCVAGGYNVDSDGVDIELSYSFTYWTGLTLTGYGTSYSNDAPGAAQGQWGTVYQNLLMIDVSNIPLNYSR